MKNEEHEYTKRYSMTKYKWNNLSMFYLARGMIVSFIVVYGVFFEQFCHEPWFYLSGRVITTCLVPMVLIMSGYHIKKRSIFSQLFRNCRKYLLPYIVAAAATGGIMYVRIMRWAGDGSSELRKVIWGYVYGTSYRTLVGKEETYGVQELWILLTLFVGLLLMNLLIRLPVLLQYAGGILLVGLGYYLPNAGVEVYCLPQACIACGFLLVGYRLRESRWYEKSIPKDRLLLLGMAGLVGVCIGRMDMEWHVYRFPMLVIPCACFAAVFLLYVCIHAGWRWQNYLIVKVVKAIGHYSFWITILFHIVNRCLPMRKVLRRIGVPEHLMGILSLLYTVLYLVIGCAAFSYLGRMLRKRKQKTIIETWKK